jgi:hypothetical protein
VRLPDISTHDGRRALSFLAVMGGAMVFTGFAAVSLYLLRDVPGFVFWLGLAAHVQILVGMTALGWQMGRRVSINAGRDGVTLSDGDGE